MFREKINSNDLKPSDSYPSRMGPIFSIGQRPLGAAYVPTLLRVVEDEQRLSGNGDREAIVVGVGL